MCLSAGSVEKRGENVLGEVACTSTCQCNPRQWLRRRLLQECRPVQLEALLRKREGAGCWGEAGCEEAEVKVPVEFTNHGPAAEDERGARG